MSAFSRRGFFASLCGLAVRPAAPEPSPLAEHLHSGCVQLVANAVSKPTTPQSRLLMKCSGVGQPFEDVATLMYLPPGDEATAWLSDYVERRRRRRATFEWWPENRTHQG